MKNDPRRGLPSASSMFRLSRCPGSLALINSLRSEGRLYQLPKPYAPSGTQIHKWLAARINQTKPEIDLTPQELRTAEMCESLRRLIVGDWHIAGHVDRPEPIDFLIERRFWYRIGLLPRFSAQPDFIEINSAGERALIINYKTGRLEPEPAADNLQLRTETVCLAQEFPTLEQIDGAILEPLVSWNNERVTYGRDALRQAEVEILAIADEAAWNTKRTAGAWCTYCPARANCPEARGYVESIPVPREGKELVELPRGEAGTALWHKIQVAEKILKSLEAVYELILYDEPNALPGLILPKQGKRRRIVPYPAKLKEALSEYLSAEEIDGCAEFYLGKIEEILGLKHHLNGTELAQKFAALIKDVVQVVYDRPFIRPLTKREREQPANVINI